MNYINNRLTNEVNKYFLMVFNQYSDEEAKRALEDYCIDEDYIVNELVPSKVAQINEEMGAYLHQKDHRIDGNFGNISRDYDGDFYKALHIVDTDNDSEEAKKFKDYCTEWFLDNIGLFRITYKFLDFLNEVVYRYEKEQEDA